MSILKMTYQADNYKPNSTLYEITVTVDEEVNNGNINTILPNNGLRFKEVSGIGYIPSGSSATIITPSAMVVSIYNAEIGIENTITKYKEGEWKILANVQFK